MMKKPNTVDKPDRGRCYAWDTPTGRIRRLRMDPVEERGENQAIDEEQRGEQPDDDKNWLEDLKVNIVGIEQRLADREQR